MDRLATRLQATRQKPSNDVESVTLFLGGNDLARHHDPNRLLADTRRVIDYFKVTFPKAKIFLADVLPRKDLAPLHVEEVSDKLIEYENILGYKLIRFSSLTNQDFVKDGIHLAPSGVNKVCLRLKVRLELPKYRLPTFNAPLRKSTSREDGHSSLSPFAPEFVPSTRRMNAWKSRESKNSGNSFRYYRPVSSSSQHHYQGRRPKKEQEVLALALKVVPIIQEILD